MNPSPRRFRQWCRWFRKRAPLDKPVRVRRTRYRPAGASALAQDRGDHYRIAIWRGLCRQAQWDALCHEWAHLYRDEHYPATGEDHDREFWEVHGELYRCAEKGWGE